MHISTAQSTQLSVRQITPKVPKPYLGQNLKSILNANTILNNTCQLFSSPAFLLVRTPSLQGSSNYFYRFIFIIFDYVYWWEFRYELWVPSEIRIDCQICPLQEQFVTAEPSFQLLHIIKIFAIENFEVLKIKEEPCHPYVTGVLHFLLQRDSYAVRQSYPRILTFSISMYNFL